MAIRSWKSSSPATHTRFQRVLHLWTKVLRRIMLFYKMNYVDITIIGDNYCSVVAKAGDPVDSDYVVHDHWN